MITLLDTLYFVALSFIALVLIMTGLSHSEDRCHRKEYDE